MTREEFINVLDEKGYSYEIEGNKVIVNCEHHVDLRYLTSIPGNVEFENMYGVDLKSLTSIPRSVEFRRNEGWWINLKSLTGGTFDEWSGNIEGIDSKGLLNKMIKDGLFER